MSSTVRTEPTYLESLYPFNAFLDPCTDKTVGVEAVDETNTV